MRLHKPYLVLAIACIPIVLTFKNPQFSEKVHEVGLSVLKPVLSLGDSMSGVSIELRDGIVRFWRSFQDQSSLQRRLAEMESKLVEYDELKKENLRLKNLLAFKDSLSGKTIAARIIGWDPSQTRKAVVIDKGRKSGVKKDMAVIVSEGLVGRVVEAGEHASKVLLLIDPESRVSAITSDTRAQGVIAGDGTGKLKMTYMDLDGGAKVEEMVLSSGVGEVFPKGIRIGKIVTLGKDIDGLHLSAVVESYIVFSKLEEVLCVDSFREASSR